MTSNLLQMIRHITILSIVLLCGFMLFGCGGSNKESKSNASQSQNKSQFVSLVQNAVFVLDPYSKNLTVAKVGLITDAANGTVAASEISKDVPRIGEALAKYEYLEAGTWSERSKPGMSVVSYVSEIKDLNGFLFATKDTPIDIQTKDGFILYLLTISEILDTVALMELRQAYYRIANRTDSFFDPISCDIALEFFIMELGMTVSDGVLDGHAIRADIKVNIPELNNTTLEIPIPPLIFITMLLSNQSLLEIDEYHTRLGFNKAGYDRDGYDKDGYFVDGFNREGFNKAGFTRDGYNREGYDKDGFNKAGYNSAGFRRDGYNDDGYDKDGFARDGYNRAGYDRAGFNREGYNAQGIDKYKYTRERYEKNIQRGKGPTSPFDFDRNEWDGTPQSNDW